MNKRLAGSYFVIASAAVGILLVLAAAPLGQQVGATTNQRLNPPPLLTTALTPSAPIFTTFGGLPVIEVDYTNNINVSATYEVYAVFHNPAGQVVSMTTAAITINVAGSQTAYLVTSLLSPGTYRATIFATTTTGVAVSPSSSISIQVA